MLISAVKGASQSYSFTQCCSCTVKRWSEICLEHFQSCYNGTVWKACCITPLFTHQHSRVTVLLIVWLMAVGCDQQLLTILVVLPKLMCEDNRGEIWSALRRRRKRKDEGLSGAFWTLTRYWPCAIVDPLNKLPSHEIKPFKPFDLFDRRGPPLRHGVTPTCPYAPLWWIDPAKVNREESATSWQESRRLNRRIRKHFTNTGSDASLSPVLGSVHGA